MAAYVTAAALLESPPLLGTLTRDPRGLGGSWLGDAPGSLLLVRFTMSVDAYGSAAGYVELAISPPKPLLVAPLTGGL
jgi:hypothetical protein